MKEKELFTYKQAGVDRQTHGEITNELKHRLQMKDPRILNRVGAFGALFRASFPGISDPVLVLKAEEPGSKQYLAKEFHKVDNVGFDMINHLINDIIVMGAIPLAVLDVIVCGKIDKEEILKIISAVNKACENQDCSLVGGEISEQPGVVPDGVFILSSSVVGVVSQSKIIDGSRIREKDKAIALASNGLFTNGYAMIRKLIATNPSILKRQVEGRDFIDVVLNQHLAYYPYLKDILGSPNIHGLAHITGDGMYRNLKRILPLGLSASIDLSKIAVLPIFKVIKEAGDVPEDDLLANFNMGVGMIMITPPEHADSMITYLEAKGLHAYEIGDIIKSDDNTVKYHGKIDWTRIQV
jgi:phosphoribosylformylglycinamidine cyclo-ligase